MSEQSGTKHILKRWYVWTIIVPVAILSIVSCSESKKDQEDRECKEENDAKILSTEVVDFSALPELSRNIFGIHLGEPVSSLIDRLKEKGIEINVNDAFLTGCPETAGNLLSVQSSSRMPRNRIPMKIITFQKAPTDESFVDQMEVYAFSNKVCGLKIRTTMARKELVETIAKKYQHAEPLYKKRTMHDPISGDEVEVGGKEISANSLMDGWTFVDKVDGHPVTFNVDSMSAVSYGYEEIRQILALQYRAIKNAELEAEKQKTEKASF